MKFVKENHSFIGRLNCPDLDLPESDVVLVGIPYEGGVSGKKGASFAPSMLRSMSDNIQTISRRQIPITDLKFKDIGDIPIFPEDEIKNYQSIHDHMNFLFQNTNCPVISIGGDHSITYPEIVALSHLGKIGVIWIDAHRDLLDELNGSKYSHGSPLRRAIEAEAVSPENVLIIGSRYMEEIETRFLNENSIVEITMPMIEDSLKPRNLIMNAIAEIGKNVEFLFLSIDIDAIDPGYAPGTGTPVAGGLSSNLLFNIINDFPMPFRAVDIVEVSPPLDTPAFITSKLQLALLTELCAKIKIWKETKKKDN